MAISVPIVVVTSEDETIFGGGGLPDTVVLGVVETGAAGTEEVDVGRLGAYEDDDEDVERDDSGMEEAEDDDKLAVRCGSRAMSH